jgi:hypothetical protein
VADHRPDLRHRLNAAGRAALLVSIAVTGGGTFLPFATSGERTRTSFQLISLARRLELVPDRWPSTATRIWFALPLLLVVCWLLVVTGRAVAGAWCMLAAALVAAAGLVAVWHSPLDAAAGWFVTCGGTVGSISSAAIVLATSQQGRGGP